MSEHVVLYLGENLEYVELNGMPAWVEDGEYDVDLPLPSEQNFTPGLDALVYSQRNNSRFIYVGMVCNLELDRDNRRVIFDSFLRFKRPVMIEDGPDYDPMRKDKVYPATKGFFREFAYIDNTRFDEAVRQSQRAAESPSKGDSEDNPQS